MNRSAGHTEPIAVQQRVSNGVLKIIFWYIGAADSTVVADRGTQQEGEDFENVWTPFDRLDVSLTFEDDKVICQKVIEVIQQQEDA